MGGTLTSIIGALGGPFGVGGALVLNRVGIPVSGGILGDLLGIGPKKPKPDTTVTPLKTQIPPRVRAYGRSRLYGAYALFETSSKGTAVDVYAVHDGRIDGIERRYLADDQVTVHPTTDSGTLASLVDELADKRYQNRTVHWYEQLGPATGTAFGAVISLMPSVWTASHRGDGVVALAVTWNPEKSDKYSETYPQGGPVPASIVARWQFVYDWRDGAQDVTNPLTWVWSENTILHLAHYRLVVEKAYRAPNEAFPSGTALQDAWDLFFAPTVEYWTTAADVADEAVALKAGGTEPRYRSCFSHKLTDAHKDVIAGLAACADAWTAPRADGALVVYAGKYYAPTVSIGPEHIVSYSWQTGLDDESAVNEITLSYISDAHDYGQVECDPWQDLDSIAARGAIRSQSLENPVPSNGQARRLAKRLMARLMAPERGTITTNVAGRIARGQRFINLRIEEAGTVFFDGPAEITQLTRNLTTGGVTFAWILADPSIDAWNPATEEGEPATVGDRVAPEPLDAPEITSAGISTDDDSADDNPGARIAIVVSGPDRNDLIWFARWRVQGGTIWNEQPYKDIDPGPTVELLTGFVPVNAVIEIEVSYQVGDGRVSPWSTLETVTTALSIMLTEDDESMSAEDDEIMIEE